MDEGFAMSAERFSAPRAVDFDAVPYSIPVEPMGMTSASLAIQLPKNTIVRRFDVAVTALPAKQTKAITAAQVRVYSNPPLHTAVIDFGVPRTLSAIVVTSANIKFVQAWTGAAFGNAFYPSGSASGSSPRAAFGSEVRSERFLVTLSGPVAGDDITLELPEPPSDLEIRINAGPPVWTSAGPVRQTTPIFVELRDALNALLADPLSQTLVPLEIRLTSRVPGVLTIAEAKSAGHEKSLAFVSRILFNGDADRTIEFAEEGVFDLALPLPEPVMRRRIEEVHLTAIGNLPAERTMPAIGPLPSLAELVLDAEHAACARLALRNEKGEEIEALTAIRLPLVTDADGAEVRVVLRTNDGGEPGAPLPGGVSDPVAFDAAAETWIRFDFPKPLPLDAANPPWLAVLASRGTVSWTLADIGARSVPTPDAALLAHHEVRLGAPDGPWGPLPPPFLPPRGFMQAAARVRIAGIGAKESPPAPLLMSLFGLWTRVTPSVKGAPISIGDRGIVDAEARLRILSRTAGTVTLRAIDVVWHPEPLAIRAGTTQAPREVA